MFLQHCDTKNTVFTPFTSPSFSQMLQTEITPWGRGADHLPLIQFCPGDLMTVLVLQGFEKITNEKLAQVLSNEKGRC